MLKLIGLIKLLFDRGVCPFLSVGWWILDDTAKRGDHGGDIRLVPRRILRRRCFRWNRSLSIPPIHFYNKLRIHKYVTHTHTQQNNNTCVYVFTRLWKELSLNKLGWKSKEWLELELGLVMNKLGANNKGFLYSRLLISWGKEMWKRVL